MPYLKEERGVISADEVWRDIPALDCKYSVSNLGRVYSNRYSRFRCTHKDRNGYYVLSICDKHYSVHRLVANAFLGLDLDSSLEINHIDGNKQNNAINNLEIVTRRENVQHAWRTGLISFEKYSRDPDREIGEIANRLRYYVDKVAKISHKEFQDRTGVSYKIMTETSKGIRRRTLDKITKVFPINPEWIKTGGGEMLIQ